MIPTQQEDVPLSKKNMTKILEQEKQQTVQEKKQTGYERQQTKELHSLRILFWANTVATIITGVATFVLMVYQIFFK